MDSKARADRLAILHGILVDTGRLLSFRRPRAMFGDQWIAYLVCGLAITSIVGMGRYWNNPHAELWQRLGLGSVAYVVLLALVLRLLLIPFKPSACTLRNVLLFLLMTAPPGLVFLMPVESFLSLRRAQLGNAVLLGLVALWRFALLFWFLRVIAGLSGMPLVVASLTPLVFIVAALALLNLEHVAIDFLNGVRPEQYSPYDLNYSIITVLSFIAVFVAPYLLAAYAWAWCRRGRIRVAVQPAGQQLEKNLTTGSQHA